MFKFPIKLYLFSYKIKLVKNVKFLFNNLLFKVDILSLNIMAES